MATTVSEPFMVKAVSEALSSMMRQALKDKLMKQAEEWVDDAVNEAVKDFHVHARKMFDMNQYGEELRVIVERKP